MKKFLSFLIRQEYYIKIFAIIFALYCALIIGISWDENYYKILGDKNLNYLLSFGTIESDYYSKFRYSTIYWSFSSLLGQIIPDKFNDQFYHLLNTFFGLLVIVGVYKVSKLLFNKSIAKVSSLFLFLLPMFFGHLAMNNKDTILALSHVWIFYYLIKYSSFEYPATKRLTIILKIASFSALGTGIQLLFLGSTLPILIFTIYNYFVINKRKAYDLIKDLIFFLLIFYFILILFWVDTHQNILILPYKFFVTTLNLDVGWPFNLSNGDYFFSNETPYYYIIENLIYKLPEFIIFLYLIFIYLLFYSFEKIKRSHSKFKINILLVFSILIYPNIVLILIPYPVYDGLRLFLWFIPYLVIIPAITINYIYENFKDKIYRFIFYIFSLLLIFHFAVFFNISPYQYTYLNFFNGKKSERYKKFEGDYWSVSIKELISKTNFDDNREIKYTTCGINSEIAKIYMKKKYKYSVNTDIKKAEYLILSNRTLYSDKRKNITNCFDEYDFKNVYIVKRNGIILSAIKKIK